MSDVPQNINPFLSFLLQGRQSNLKRSSNRIYYSEVTQEYTPEAFCNTGVKYVIEGTEYYKLGKEEYKLGKGYLLFSGHVPGATAWVDSQTAVKGICVDIIPETINDIFYVLSSKDKIDLDNINHSIDQGLYYFEHVALGENSLLGPSLQKLAQELATCSYTLPFLNEEWFMNLAELMMCEQYTKWQILNRLNCQKTSTRKEVFRRLQVAKDYMDSNFLEALDIKSVASACYLSEFHFFRSFKDAFGITPYQYLLKKRLEFAFELLSTGKATVAEISITLNFTDVAAFSNAFKKRFGFSPSRLPG